MSEFILFYPSKVRMDTSPWADTLPVFFPILHLTVYMYFILRSFLNRLAMVMRLSKIWSDSMSIGIDTQPFPI